MAASTYHWEYQPEVGIYEVAKTNASTGVTSNASATAPVENFNQSYHTIANVSYVTGSHAFKTGVNLTRGNGRTKVEPHGDIVRLTFQTQTSGTVTIRNSPVTARERLNADVGFYGQDKWTLNRLTITPGVRFDYLNASLPAQTAPAGRFVPARSAPATPCLPCWKDWSLRLGGSYDVFGNGKTALKASVGKYLASMALGRAEGSNPIRSDSDNRTWNDLDRNGSALDANGNAQYSEIAPVGTNVNFGPPIGATRFDQTTPRPANWEQTVSVQQEVWPGVAVTGGYYHRSFQNQTITRNLAIDAQRDYTPYMITAPRDPRLPNGGGEVITRYNLNPAKQLTPPDSVSTFSTLNTRVYDGVEVSINARLPRNAFVLGGVTTQRTATNNCDVFFDYQNQLDMRASRAFRAGRKRFQAYVDVFNVLNASTVVSLNSTFGSNTTLNPNYLQPLVVMQARRVQLGGRFDF
jgi:hypothetical protein